MKYWVWLSQLTNIRPITANRLLAVFGSPENIYMAEEKELININGITNIQVKSILESKKMDITEGILEKCLEHKISILTKNNNLYPYKAKKQIDAPILLYYKGTLRKVEKTVGIVGARRCTQEDKIISLNITNKYIEDNWIIISGMAKGIDSYAHTACIKAGGYTIAILGNGLDICYPSEHKQLKSAIEENGLLLSEYPPGTTPSKYTFPRRNRLISAWSDELVVISAGKGSGALITANYARKYGKNVVLH